MANTDTLTLNEITRELNREAGLAKSRFQSELVFLRTALQWVNEDEANGKEPSAAHLQRLMEASRNAHSAKVEYDKAQVRCQLLADIAEYYQEAEENNG